MSSPFGQTSHWLAVARAVESDRADALFIDPYAKVLAGSTKDELHQFFHEHARPGAEFMFLSAVSIRTKYYDNELLNAMHDGVRQFVILGAGMDTRAFRLPFRSDCTVWELDLPEVFDEKEPKLKELAGHAFCKRRVVPVDLREDWTDTLCRAGFDSSRSAVFIAEGFLVYLSETDVDQLMRRLATVSTADTRLFFDVLSTEVLEFARMQQLRDLLDSVGVPWKFTTRNPEAFFERYGWTAHVTIPGDPEAHFNRWPFPHLSRSVPGIPRIYLCVATPAV